MKHESERVEGKNYRLFRGEPLFFAILRTLSSVERVARIVVNTDSTLIRGLCSEQFPGVVCIDRPEALRGNDVPITEIIRHDAERFESPWYLQTHSTNPLLRASTIDRAIDGLERAEPGQDSLMSVNRIQARVYDREFRAVNHEIGRLLRTQDLPPLYEENSNLFIFTRELALTGRRHGTSPILFEMDRFESLDIDEENEFAQAERLAQLEQGDRPSAF